MTLEIIKCWYSNLCPASHADQTPNFLEWIVKILKKYKIITICSKYSRLWNNSKIDLNIKIRLLREICQKLKLHQLSDQQIVALLYDRNRQRRLFLSIYLNYAAINHITYKEKMDWLASDQVSELQNFHHENMPTREWKPAVHAYKQRLSELGNINKQELLRKIEAFKHPIVFYKGCSTE
jgi:hypothetical protein